MGRLLGGARFLRLGGFGLGGVSFTNLEELDAVFEDFVSGEKAALWDFHISDQIASPVMRRLTGAKK